MYLSQWKGSERRMDTKLIKKALRKRTLYDFVAENYWNMTKEQLKELILNLDWVATADLTDAQEEEFYKKVEEELENRDFFLE